MRNLLRVRNFFRPDENFLEADETFLEADGEAEM